MLIVLKISYFISSSISRNNLEVLLMGMMLNSFSMTSSWVIYDIKHGIFVT